MLSVQLWVLAKFHVPFNVPRALHPLDPFGSKLQLFLTLSSLISPVLSWSFCLVPTRILCFCQLYLQTQSQEALHGKQVWGTWGRDDVAKIQTILKRAANFSHSSRLITVPLPVNTTFPEGSSPLPCLSAFCRVNPLLHLYPSLLEISLI